MVRTSDGGASWSNTIEASGPPRYVIGALSVGPGGTGAAGTTGTPGLVWYRTTDGGDHWAADPAVVAGHYGQMWRTEDGGATWTPVAIPSAPVNGRSWHLAPPAAGVAFAPVVGQTQSFVYRTTDYGASWEQRSAGIPASTGLTSVSFPTSDLGFACGHQSSQARIYKTTDGGGSWSPVGMSGITNWPWDIQWFDAQVGLAIVYVSPGGIFRTTDGGTTWNNVWSANAYDLAFSDPLHGAAGPQGFNAYGSIAVTEDGGATWERLDLPATAAGSALSATPDGFLVGGATGVVVRVTRVCPVGLDAPEADAGAAPAGSRLLAPRAVGPRIELAFELPAAGPAELAIFDPAGRRVALLARGDYPAGATVGIAWEGRLDAGDHAAAGVYFARLLFAGEAKAVKITLVRP